MEEMAVKATEAGRCWKAATFSKREQGLDRGSPNVLRIVEGGGG